MANVTSGFADAWRRRGIASLGIAPPLLGLFILLAAAQQWSSFWGARDSLTMGPWQLLTSMGMALPYIFVSHAMFPVDGKEGDPLEGHCFEQREVVLVALLIPPILSMTYNILAHAPLSNFVDYSLGYELRNGPRIVIPVVMLFWRDNWVHRIGYALLCVWVLFRLFA